MIDTDKYNDYISRWIITGNPNGDEFVIKDSLNVVVAEVNVLEDAILMKDAPLLLAEVKRLRVGIRNILSDYDITELIRDVPEDEWNFEQQALVRMKELIE